MSDIYIALAISMLLNIIFIATINYIMFAIILKKERKVKKE